jgi:diguanylate cyclase (GGDEF)-like protein
VAALEETLGKAIRAKTAEMRGQRQRRLWIGGAAASYALDVVCLALFALTGVIGFGVPIAYAITAAVLSMVFYGAVSSGRTERLRDPGLVAWQALAGVLMQLGVVAAAPQIAFPYLANLLTVFAFAMIWLPLGAAVSLWALASSLCGLLLFVMAERISVPTGSAAQIGLVWLYFTLVLGRCVLLSVFATGMRERIADSRRKLARSMEQVQELATHDELTKALNRRALMARLEQEKARVARDGGILSIALLDLDHFKAVNDRFGHAAGDRVLQGISAIVRGTMRETDVFGRYGGEEFMMILPGTSPEAARAALERVRSAIEQSRWPEIDAELRVNVSAGLSAYRLGEITEQALSRADAALYEAKRKGRNRVEAI